MCQLDSKAVGALDTPKPRTPLQYGRGKHDCLQNGGARNFGQYTSRPRGASSSPLAWPRWMPLMQSQRYGLEHPLPPIMWMWRTGGPGSGCQAPCPYGHDARQLSCQGPHLTRVRLPTEQPMNSSPDSTSFPFSTRS